MVKLDGLLWVVAALPSHSSMSPVSVMISSSLCESHKREEEVEWARGSHASQQCVTKTNKLREDNQTQVTMGPCYLFILV